MDKRLTKRLIALILSGGILLSSTGVYTALAASEEYTTSEYTSALVDSDETVTDAPETTVPSTSESATSGTTEAETTTEKETEAESTTILAEKPAVTPSTTVKNETTTLPPFVGEEETVVETPEDNKGDVMEGSGSQTDPYRINSVEDFLKMNEYISDSGNVLKYFKLVDDIDLSGIIDSNYSARESDGIAGALVSVNPAKSDYSADKHFFHLDGAGHSIKGLEFTSNSYNSLGIFGYVNSNSSISNVVFEDITIENTMGYSYATGIVLKNEGKISNCVFKNITLTMDKTSEDPDSYLMPGSLRAYSGVGCIVDNSAEGIIDNETKFTENDASLNDVTVLTNRSYAGALVAQNRGYINKFSAANVTVKGKNHVGGLVGANLTEKTYPRRGIDYCEVIKGSVTGADAIGFLAGSNKGRIYNAKVEGNFKSSEKATSDGYNILIPGKATAGGITGENTGDIQSCNATDIGVYFADATDGATYGGIVGETTYSIKKCIATGSTAGEGTAYQVERYIGGIVGYGSTDEGFSVVNCYALVKIIESKVPLGAIVGFNGDDAYKKNKIEEVYYSSIISSRPSPVSYGATGEAQGDLIFTRPYAVVNHKDGTNNNNFSVNTSDFDFSGWNLGSGDITVNGNFRVKESQLNCNVSVSSDKTRMNYTLARTGDATRTLINYDVKIKLPSTVGANPDGTILENEPMEFGVLNLGSDAAADPGEGTISDPYILSTHRDFNLLYYAPAGNFKVASELTLSGNSYLVSTPATFWGTVDFDGNTLTLNTDKPLFKGIYGQSDVASANSGVVKNLTVNIITNISVRNFSSLFGNLCNANVSNISVTFGSTLSAIVPTESDTGLFAKAVYGNTRMYGCYVASTYSAVAEGNENKELGDIITGVETSYSGVSGFIGVIDADAAVIDNCGSDIVVRAQGSNLQNLAVFVSTIKSLNGGEIKNCYATGGIVKKNGSYDAKTCNIFAANIESDSSETIINNCYYSPSYVYNEESKGVTVAGVMTGIKAGSFTGTCKQWTFQEETESGELKDITMKIVSGEVSGIFLENLKNFGVERFVFDPNAVDDNGKPINYFVSTSVKSADTVSLDINSYSLENGKINVSTSTFDFPAPEEGQESSASVTLYVRHKETGLVTKLVVRSGSAFGKVDGWYIISTAEQLYTLADKQNDLDLSTGKPLYKDPDTKIKLGADIDMAGLTINPIGNSALPFTGIFDGQGYTISNLTYDGKMVSGEGLFGYVKGSVNTDGDKTKITNVHLDNVNVVNGRSNSGVLIGTIQDYAVVENCTIKNSSIIGEKKVGALVGAITEKDKQSEKTTISGCVVENTVVTSSKSNDQVYIGAIVGGIGDDKNTTRAADITNCTVKNCTVSAKGYGIGGMVGYASNIGNTISGCIVEGSEIVATEAGLGINKASLAGVAAIYGGSISNTTVRNTKVTGECASGVVGRIINTDGTATISDCTVEGCEITAPDIAGSITAIINGYEQQSYNGKKVISNCKITVYNEDENNSKNTTVKARVAGGIVGAIYSQFSAGELAITNCTNLGVIETTGRKGSQEDAAGGIIGRLSLLLDTSGIQISKCLSQGEIKGNSNLGGIVGMNSANAHTGANLITDSYVTTKFSSKNLAVVKGLAIGYVGTIAGGSSSVLANNLYFSSLNNKEPLFGNNTETAGGKDANKGGDWESGLLVDLTTSYAYNRDGSFSTTQKRYYPYFIHAIENYQNGVLGTTNEITLKTNFFIGQDKFEGVGGKLTDVNGNPYVYNDMEIVHSTNAAKLTQLTVPRFSVGNQPVIPDTNGANFSAPADKTEAAFTTNTTKIYVGCGNNTGSPNNTYNRLSDVNIQTFDKKCEALVKTTYTGIVNGETVKFDVGFTVRVNGTHDFDGKGTLEDPFIIRDAEDLLSIKQHHDNPVKNDTYTDPYFNTPEKYYAKDTYYKVVNDIDLTEELNEKSFAPIGTKDEPFMATILTEGDNQYKISGLVINKPDETGGYAYNTAYGGDKAEYSDALGLFGYTDGAKIYNLELENVTISSVPSVSNKILGASTGALIGVAKDTTVENVKVTGEIAITIEKASDSAVGGIVGQALNDVILKDVSVIGTDDGSGIEENYPTIKGTYYVGGIVGRSKEDATGCSITNPVVDTVKITNESVSGTSVVGGIAGQFSGTITGTNEPVTDEEGNIIEPAIYAKVNNAIIEGIIVGGIAGSGSTNQNSDIPLDLNIEYAKVTNSDIRVFEGVQKDTVAAPNGVAGGILGQSADSFNHYITNCTVDADTTVTSSYCAGGIVGRADNNGGIRGKRENNLIISDSSTFAKVTQMVESVPSTNNNITKTGAGAVIGVIGYNANVMSEATFAPQIQVKNVTAGGVVTGSTNVGGIVGQFASTQWDLNLLTDSLVYDCIVSAKIDTLSERAGIIFGSIESNTKSGEVGPVKNPPFPDTNYSDGKPLEYSSRIVDEVLYSSYMTGSFKLYGNSVVNNYQGKAETESKVSAAEALSVYTSIVYKDENKKEIDKELSVIPTVCDVNQVMYNYNNNGTPMKMPLSIIIDGIESGEAENVYQYFDSREYNFSDNFIHVLNANGVEGGTPFGFEILGEKFELTTEGETITGVQSENGTNFRVIKNPDYDENAVSTDKNYTREFKIEGIKFGVEYLVFTYKNGLKIGIQAMVGTEFDGSGTIDDPIDVPDANTFALWVPLFANTGMEVYFKQTDSFNMDKVTMPLFDIVDFSMCHYDGGGHSIENYNITKTSSETPVGIFGKMSDAVDEEGNRIYAEVKNLTLINCNVNGGATTVGTGVVAGELSNGAKISNVTLQGCNATSENGPVGGVVGIVTGGSTVEEVTVTGTEDKPSTVTTTKGSAGGVVGIMDDNNSKIIAPVVEYTTVTSGNDAEDIAGGIVAQAYGTITGTTKTDIDADGNTIETVDKYAQVNNVTVNAFISGGAVGAVYKPGTPADADIGRSLTLEAIRVSGTTVNAKSAGAGLLGFARSNSKGTSITVNDCRVDKTSVINSEAINAYAAGAVAQVDSAVTSLQFIDVESFATVNSKSETSDGRAYAASLVAYVDNDPNKLSFDGCVAGGNVTATAVNAFAAGVIAGFSGDFASTPITGEESFFANGVISANLKCEKSSASGPNINPVHKKGRFISGYGEGMFDANTFRTMFSGNYYSSYPDGTTPFFANDNSLDQFITWADDSDSSKFGFKDVGSTGRLVLSVDEGNTWKNVAIVPKSTNEISLFAKVDEDVGVIPYGSENNRRTSKASDGFDFKDNTVIEKVGEPVKNGDGSYKITITAKNYGATELIAEYDCGLATRAIVISIDIRGDGSETNPFLVGTPSELFVASCLTGLHYRQYQDIKLESSYSKTSKDIDEYINYNNGSGFSPIGTENGPFTGTYDGQGYKITGLRIDRPGEDSINIGLFGVVKDGIIKNVHLELMDADAENSAANGIVGGTNVGGIAGKAENAYIENCSVTIGSVTGKNNVGGIVGNFTTSKIKNCFTQSDVNAFGAKVNNKDVAFAGGIVGYINDADANKDSYISGCFASGSIYAMPTGEKVDESNAAGIVSYIQNAKNLSIDNCLFTGTTASGYGILGRVYGVNLDMSITNCIDAGQNVAMNAVGVEGDEFTKISSAVSHSTALGNGGIAKENIYYDNSLLIPDFEPAGVTGMSTKDLVAKAKTMGDGWQNIADHYPVPEVSNFGRILYAKDKDGKPDVDKDGIPIIVDTKPSAEDAYSLAYSKFLSAPIYTDAEKEKEDAAYGKGLVYPVTLLTEIDGKEVTYSSSIFDTTDTGDYPANFDEKLYGAPKLDTDGSVVRDEEGNIVYHKNTDLLFGNNKETKRTTVYRNIFDNTVGVDARDSIDLSSQLLAKNKNTFVNKDAASGSVFSSNGEAYFNAQVPVVYATAEIDGVDVQRDIKIPLNYGRSYCIATQRQLFALGGNEADTAPEDNENHKFNGYYGYTRDYKLLADIDCSNLKYDDGTPIPFTPIGWNKEPYAGRFDGSGKKISNLTIGDASEPLDNIGLFSEIKKEFNGSHPNPSVKNLTLENVIVNGRNNVGALVGSTEFGYVTIENCHVTGEVIYKLDANDEIIKDEKTGDPIIEGYKGSVTGTGSNVGGLVGEMKYSYKKNSEGSEQVEDPRPKLISCTSTIKVTGSENAVGGLIGNSSAVIQYCYAIGNVICEKLPAGKGEICGVGGLIGVMTNGSATESFASGNVEVKCFNKGYDFVAGNIGIGGFVGYVSDMVLYDNNGNSTPFDGVAITSCFSGGNVKFGTGEEGSKDIKPNQENEPALFGIGGFSGINHEKIEQVYSSAAVNSKFGIIADAKGTHGVGIGGVAGIAFDNVKEVYSSGSVSHGYTDRTSNNGSYYYYGGTIGYDNATCTYCYYDSWTNNDPNLTSIGNKNDTKDEKSYTTEALTSGKRPEQGSFPGEVWGFTPNAYPYLTKLLDESVTDNYIKTNAILSVVCVNPEPDDILAKTNRGVSQALIVPSEFTYSVYDSENDRTLTYAYKLKWSGATLNGNRAAINRSKNINETVTIKAYVSECTINGEPQKDENGNIISYQEYADRDYERLCANMLGTFDRPYLISNADDLAHVNMTESVFAEAQEASPEHYGQWATPIDDMGNPLDAEGNVITENDKTSGVVHYQLMSNVDASTLRDGISNGEASYIVNGNTINYNGFMLKGNGYAITNANPSGCFFDTVDANSTITNIIFDGFTFEDKDSALIKENKGKLQDVYVRAEFRGKENVAGLVLTNEGTIDGCVVDAKITNASSGVGVMAVTNNGIITNSGTAGTLKTGKGDVTDIGAFVVNNNGEIKNSFSMADIDVLAEAGEGAEKAAVTNVSGFAVNNAGTIDSVYTRSGISFKETPADTNTIASLVSNITNETDAEPVTNSYAAAYLGYFSPDQDSILFGTVPKEMGKLSSVFVDKSLAGTPSKDSYKYSSSLSSIMSMEYMPGTMINGTNNEEGFIAHPKKVVLPQHATIINAENNRVIDAEKNIIYVDKDNPTVTYTLVLREEEGADGKKVNVYKFFCSEDGQYYPAGDGNKSVLEMDGESVKVDEDRLTTLYDYYLGDNDLGEKTIIRNYDVLKAYSEISTLAIKTGQSQYIDKLAKSDDSALKSELSDLDGNKIFSHNNKAVSTSGSVMSAVKVDSDTVTPQYSTKLKLLRDIEIEPKLYIDVKVVDDGNVNPNFSGGMGTIDSPYVISDAASLASLHYYGTEEDLYFVLGADIDMSPEAEDNKDKGYDDFQIHHFKAHLNDLKESNYDKPTQYTIKNFTSGKVNEDGTVTAGYGGLFGTIEKDAVVNNVALSGKVISDEQYTGALANIIEGKVTNCVVAADVTSTFEEIPPTEATEDTPAIPGKASATGVLAGRVTNGANISAVVTTGSASTTDTDGIHNVVGGVIGSAQNAEMSNILSTSTVKTYENGALAGGIIGEMIAETGETTSLNKVLFGGFADGYAVDPEAEPKIYNAYPIVASKSESAKVTDAYYDNQMNNRTLSDGIIGEGYKTKAYEELVVFDISNAIGSGYYPVPMSLENVENSTFKATTSLAAVTMNFYLGASTGEKGHYTAIQFNDNASIEKFVVGSEKYTTADNKEKTYFGISDGYNIVTNVYNPSKDPVLTLSLESNGAVRKVYPGLANNANITYTIKVDEESGFSQDAEQLLGVLLKSVSNNNVNVLNDFTSKIGESSKVLTLVIAQNMDGFYVDEMLPKGYEYTVTATVNGKETEVSDDSKVNILKGVEADENGNVETNVELTLTITNAKKTWGVNSIVNTIWHTNTLGKEE